MRERGAWVTIVVALWFVGAATPVAAGSFPLKQLEEDNPGPGGPTDLDTALQVSADSMPLLLPGPAWSGLQHVELQETGGAVVTLRLTPLDELSNPVDGGTVVTLLPGETRTLTARYSLKDLGGARPVVVVSGWNVPRTAAR